MKNVIDAVKQYRKQMLLLTLRAGQSASSRAGSPEIDEASSLSSLMELVVSPGQIGDEHGQETQDSRS